MSFTTSAVSFLLNSLSKCTTQEEYVEKIYTYAKSAGAGWWNGIPTEIQIQIVNFIDTVAPLSKGYDQVAMLQAILNAFKLSKKVRSKLLKLCGCIEVGDAKCGLAVVDHSVFWSFFLTVSGTNLNDSRSVAETCLHPIMQILAQQPKEDGATGLLWVITDPGTDPNSDDEKAVQFMEKARLLLGLWSKVIYIISARNSLGERQERLSPLLKAGSHVVIYDTSEEKNRFWPPAAFSWGAKYKSFSFDEIWAMGQYPGYVIVIGQLGQEFANKLASKYVDVDGKFQYLGIQGPGFNTKGIDKTDIDTVLRPLAEIFGFTDRDGACKVSKGMLEESFKILDLDSPSGSSYRVMQVITFMNTNNGPYFQNMFNGFDYTKHFVPILKMIQKGMATVAIGPPPRQKLTRSESCRYF